MKLRPSYCNLHEMSCISFPIIPCDLRFLKRFFTLLFVCVITYFTYISSREKYSPLFVVSSYISSNHASFNNSVLITQKEPDVTVENEDNKSWTKLSMCPPIPSNLSGPIPVILESVPSIEEQEDASTGLLPGGHFKNLKCQSNFNVAILVPYRDRQSHLEAFLYHMHPFLQKQQIDYTIFIIEQSDNENFNRASLLNVGYLEALRIHNFDCFIFHDIDLLPEDDRNLYTCSQQPRHMSVAISSMKYQLPYEDYFGGVNALTTEQFKALNGFSNQFWGWGGEDDDFFNRAKSYGFHILRYPGNISRYTMMKHRKAKPNPSRFTVLKGGKYNFDRDGLNNIKYEVLGIEYRKLYTWINVKLLKASIRQ